MIEVLVALVLIAIGLLGIAGVQALSVNNTTIALNRSTAALQADGLASMMHANSVYWQSASAPTESGGFTITATTGSGATTTISDSNLNGQTQNCSQANCSAPQMAGYDLQQWGLAVAAALPSGSGQVTCVAGTPVFCTINVLWNENNIALNGVGNTSTSTNAYAIGTTVTQTYTLVVQP